MQKTIQLIHFQDLFTRDDRQKLKRLALQLHGKDKFASFVLRKYVGLASHLISNCCINYLKCKKSVLETIRFSLPAKTPLPKCTNKLCDLNSVLTQRSCLSRCECLQGWNVKLTFIKKKFKTKPLLLSVLSDNLKAQKSTMIRR